LGAGHVRRLRLWGAPQGSAIVIRNAVPIVPNVAGELIRRWLD
jgi:hypothetical protein